MHQRPDAQHPHDRDQNSSEGSEQTEAFGIIREGKECPIERESRGYGRQRKDEA